MMKLVILKISFNHTVTRKKKRFDRFAIRIFWNKENQVMCEVKLPNEVVMKELWFVPRHINRIPMNLIKPTMPRNNNKTSKFLLRSCVDYLDSFHIFSNDFCDEITIIFISDLEDISYFPYKEQPRSML